MKSSLSPMSSPRACVSPERFWWTSSRSIQRIRSTPTSPPAWSSAAVEAAATTKPWSAFQQKHATSLCRSHYDNCTISMKTEQTPPIDEDHEMWLRAPDKASNAVQTDGNTTYRSFKFHRASKVRLQNKARCSSQEVIM